MSRKCKKRSPIKRSESAALAPRKAELPTRGGAPAGRPAWAPDGVDLDKGPGAVRQAVAEVIEPAYRQMVVEAEDPLERTIGLTLVHLMWLEVLDQHEAKHAYLETSNLEVPEDRSDTIDRHLRMLNTKVKVGAFLTRLREMRRRSETAAPSQPAPEPLRHVPQMANAKVHRECGKRENCHPKNPLSVLSDQLSVTRSRGGACGQGHKHMVTVENMKTATQKRKLGVGS